MKRTNLILLTAVISLSLGLAADAVADISNAAVLFLRIAPGSRAAGMGEAHVAIAEDATATHWNPAGLGNYPLADTWLESEIPARYRPITAFAPLSTGGSRDYLDYDVWAISPEGLIRYDNKNWSTGEVFGTRTDETVVGKVRNYFNVTDDQRLAAMVAKVAEANNRGSHADLVELRDHVLATVPEAYDRRTTVASDLDSLVACYELCRLNWDRVDEARQRLQDGLKDSVLNDTECDRIAVALERARNRFLPEDLLIPYGALFPSEITAIASTGEILVVGSSDGLARFNGSSWQMMDMNDGLPSPNITALYSMGGSVLVGTDSGMAVFSAAALKPLAPEDSGLPTGVVEAIGGGSLTDVYAVVNGELYRFDGRRWTNAVAYTVAIGDSLGGIADRYSIYRTPADRERFKDKLTAYYSALDVGAEAAPAQLPAEVQKQEAMLSEPSGGNGSGQDGIEPTVDSAGTPVEPAAAPAVETGAPTIPGVPGVDTPLEPGSTIQVPMVASIKGAVKAVYVDMQQRIWLGTDNGIFYFDGRQWVAPGYHEHVVAEGETLDNLVELRSNLADEQKAAYREQLKRLSDIDDSPVAGDTVLVYANTAARAVNAIASDADRTVFATEDGLIEFDGYNWSRADLRGLSHENIVGASLLGEEAWVAGDDRLIIKGRGHSEISLMHVNWLPELADDLYYEYLSAVAPKEGWGTFGGSITFISYGKFTRTGATGPEPLGEFESFDIAIALSYGTSLTPNLKGGVTGKFIYSRLADQGAGKEKGQGTASGFAIDVGILYLMSSRLTFGAALTNLGPKMAYIDAAQSDDLPRNLAFGFAYKLMRSDYINILVTAEANKLMVGLDDGFSREIEEMIFNAGAEFAYSDLIAFRAGYIYDQEGDIRAPTLGFGLSPVSWGSFDFAYIPSSEDLSLANTVRVSLRFIL